jgi:uncharacterized protein (TIGR00375 family)
MRIVADLHIHSRFSRATSPSLDFPVLFRGALEKGIQLLGTGDFTHPGWMGEIEEQLEPAEEGLFKLKPALARAARQGVARACASADVRFVLQVEISNVYRKDGRVRKNHNLVYVPSLAAARGLNARLAKLGNLASDGRPILRLDARDLLEMVIESDPRAFLIPAHIWTPWFSMLGSRSGFDSLGACFGDLSTAIFAVETGLSSDPPMNWRVGSLDGLTLVSSSDAHSASRLGREACLLDIDLGYESLLGALRTRDGFLGTLEFHPEQGKYHFDGHRSCGVRFAPGQTRAHGGCCPACGKPLTVGVASRVHDLADHPEGRRPESARPFENLLALEDIASQVLGVGPGTKKVRDLVAQVLSVLGPELHVLREAPLEDVRRVAGERAAEGIRRVRVGQVTVESGYDGEYGVVQVFDPPDRLNPRQGR